MEARPFFAVDVGNTRTKIGCWRDVESGPFPDAELADASETFEAVGAWLRALPFDGGGAARWLVSSVNDRKAAALEAAIRRFRPLDAFSTLRLADVPIPGEYDYPEKLGIDRAVAAFAGVRLLGAGRPFLAVDVGTAATIDWVDERGVFRGGAILPGPRLIAESLQAKTASLPAIDDPENEGARLFDYPATETTKAIRLGVVYSLVGAISAFYWQTRRRLVESGVDPTRLALLIAGGDARAIERRLRTLFDDWAANFEPDFAFPRPDIVVEPRLLSFGLREIARSTNAEKRD
jgi:type III pantothenate kinase